MYRVTDEQIDFILNDIKQRGVEMEDLQNNLLDHICCMLEQNCKDEKDFEIKYQNTIKQFFKTELWEIEEETILLLRYKHYYKMKRFLYILLFLSVSYNIYVFGRMGYFYYQEKNMFSDQIPKKDISFKEGYSDLVSGLSKTHPETLKKEYICVYFPGDPRSDFEKEHFYNPYVDDTTGERRRKLYRYRELFQMDSVAAKYRNVAFVFAYKNSHEGVEKAIRINKYIFKNVVFADNQYKLFSGFCNERKDRFGFTGHLFVVTQSGELLYTSKYPIEQHVFLSRFLKTLPAI